MKQKFPPKPTCPPLSTSLIVASVYERVKALNADFIDIFLVIGNWQADKNTSWRKGWDSNPRGSVTPLPVFKTGALNRSATLPTRRRSGSYQTSRANKNRNYYHLLDPVFQGLSTSTASITRMLRS
jgi:murein endopeptidase